MKRFFVHLLFLLLICQTALAIEPYALACEYIKNPVGVDNFQPVLGWKLSSGEQNQSQTAYEIQVALLENDLAQGKNSVWKTGKKLSSQSFNIPYGGKKLQSFTRYYWRVKVYDRDGKASGWSSTASFETAMLYASDWQAQWISDGSTAPQKEDDFYKDNPAPAFRKTFSAKKQVKQARLYITGLGYYEAALNGQPAGDRKLEPGWTNYNKEILYSVYDITPLLLLGEHYDARRELPEWKPAVKITPPAGKLTAQMQPPIRITKIIKPVRMTEVRPGTFIFDMGQNMAGAVRIKVKGEKGATVRLRYGEDIRPIQISLPTKKNTTYVCRNHAGL